jgi:hypothetical protein
MIWKTTCSLTLAGMLVAGSAFAQTGSPPPGGSPSSPPQQGTPGAPVPEGQSEKSNQSKTHRKHGARGKLQPCAPGTTSTPEAPCRPAGAGKSSSTQLQPGGATK